MFALNGDRLEERTTVLPGVDWKDYFFVRPSRTPKLPDGVFKARMAAWSTELSAPLGGSSQALEPGQLQPKRLRTPSMSASHFAE